MESRATSVKLKRRLSFYLAVILSLALAFVLFTKSQFLPYQVSNYVNGHLLDDPRFEFSCNKISGNLFNRMVLHEPVLRYHAPDASFNVFRADDVIIDYELLEALKMNLVVTDLRLRNIRLQIRKDDQGALILPIPLEQTPPQRESSISPKVDVQNFVIDGLQVHLGGGEREFSVRDVNLQGSLSYAQGTGRLEINQGDAYLIDSETPVQAIEVDVAVEQSSIEVNYVAARLGRSFVTGNGAYKNGRLERMQLIFNPVVLEELYSFGLIPDLSGEFGGNVVLNGTLDSLSMVGSVTGAGLGIAVRGLSFDALAANNRLEIYRLDGRVFNARFRGAFYYELTGDNSYGFEGECRDLDLTHGFLPDRGLPVTNLNGRVKMDYNGGDGSYAFETELDSARFENYSAGTLNMKGRWTDKTGLQLERFNTTRPGYTVTGSGTIDAGGTADVIFDLDGDDLSYFWDYASLPPISGILSVRGKISGPTDDLQINLNGDVFGVRYMFAEVDTGRVQAEIRGVGGDDVSASADLAGNTVRLGGQKHKGLHLYLEASGGSTVVRDLSFSRGDTSATMHFEVSTLNDTSTIDFKHIAITAPTEEWSAVSPGVLTVSPGGVRVDSLVFVSHSGVIGISGVYSLDEETCDVHGWGQNFELSLLREAFGLPFRLKGSSGFDVRVGGRINNPTVALDLLVRDGAVDSLDFDLLRLQGGFDGRRYRLVDLLVVNAGDSITVTGWGDLDRSPVVLFSGGWDENQAAAAALRLEFTGAHFPVPELLKALHATEFVGGDFTGSVVVENNVRDPHVHLRGAVDPRPGRSTALPPTTVDARYQNGKIDIDEIVVSGDINARLSGSVPVALSLTEAFELDHDGPLELTLRVESGDISRLKTLTEVLSLLSGEFEGAIEIGGSLNAPIFNGRIDVKRGAVKIAMLDEAYTDINATLDFVDNKIRLSSISGKSRGKQAFFGSGSVTMDGFKPSGYRLDLLLRDFWLSALPELETLLNGNLTVTAIEEEGGRRIPNITGNMEVAEATVGYTFESAGGRPATVTLPTASPGWLCSVDLEAENNVWVRNPDMNIELGGRLILKRDYDGLYFRGDLNILRGSYILYNNKFRIIDGSLNFSAAEVIRPEVYINAYTPHRLESGQERRIYLTLTWPHDKKEPTLQLSYDDPGYYETDIWRMLGGTDIAGGFAANTLEKLLNQQMSGLTIDVERRSTNPLGNASDPERELTIGVGKYLWEDVYLRYKQGLTLATEREVEVEYRISNMFLIRSQIIRHSARRSFGNIHQTADEYNLDVKFRFEY